MTRNIYLCFAWSLCLLAPDATAQPAANQTGSPRQHVNGAFDRNAPQVGQPLPDIDLLDASGNKFNLSALRGHYTVLVFGCLT